jgi:prepilin-type N-terminal cleavage/methylation domain-containing protein
MRLRGGTAARARRRRERLPEGFTLVELIVAVVVLAIAIGGISSSMVSSMALNRVNGETAIAQQAARGALEALGGVPFDEIWAVYNADPADDGGLSLAARGPNFAVPGLDPQDADIDGMCGRIEFPAVWVGVGQELREDVVDAGLGVPRDLDGDGAWPEAVNVAPGYVLLPVRVWVEWRGVSGDRSVQLETMLCPR